MVFQEDEAFWQDERTGVIVCARHAARDGLIALSIFGVGKLSAQFKSRF